MVKKVEITKKQAGKFLAKGKKRRSDIQHDHDLEAKHEKFVAEAPVKTQEATPDSRVGAGALRGMVGETIARVYSEIWPGMKVRDQREEDVDLEIQEEAYITVLTMVAGNNDDKPRKPLKIREAEISNAAVYCREHS